MNKGTCSLVGCEKPARTRGLCNGHHLRLLRYGDPTATKPRPTFAERFWAKVDRDGDCWTWKGARFLNGYGAVRGQNGTLYAHRVSWEMHHGAIPPGLVIDHTCHNRACVNPGHLRTVTTKQNAENHGGLGRANTSGVRGVCWDRAAGRWLAQVGHGDRNYSVGHYDDIDEAAAAVLAKRNELHTHNDLDRI